MFKKILIANRGEIAVRIIRTAQRLGIYTVSIHSEAESPSLHVAMADEAISIGAASGAESYLDGERIIDAARASGAEAIHPGYGFLSENPEFADAVEKAGLVFIGPSAKSMRAMALKDAAKRLMEKAGVPVVPGYHGEAQELVVLAGKAREIGYPILIKARAGGGGKGMRRVDNPDAFANALSAAKREAKAAFGDGRVLLERLVEKPRHIEVQIFGDRHGNVVHLYERDCSIQRRHQKVIEEAPAPGMTNAMRTAMTDAALKAARAIDYRGAGTVEFIVDTSEGLKPDRFWFMEMNTRLQVEHPVTEMTTGIDLVEWQLRVATGEALPCTQSEIALNGHAVEARLYAEDPGQGFLPATGTIHYLKFPDDVAGGQLRIDAGVREGDKVSAHYDPLLAKLIVQADERAEAFAALGRALAESRIVGCTVNTGFLARLVRHPEVLAGNVDTGLIDRHRDVLTRVPEPDTRMISEAALAAAAPAYEPQAQDPFEAISAYGHFHPLVHRRTIYYGEQALPHTITGLGDGQFLVTVETAKGQQETVMRAAASASQPGRWPGHVTFFRDGDSHVFSLQDPLEAADEAYKGETLRAPMPGLVKIVHVEAGQKVRKDHPLLVLEAMKMEHTVLAPHDGIIAETASEGTRVDAGVVLVYFEK